MATTRQIAANTAEILAETRTLLIQDIYFPKSDRRTDCTSIDQLAQSGSEFGFISIPAAHDQLGNDTPHYYSDNGWQRPAFLPACRRKAAGRRNVGTICVPKNAKSGADGAALA
jgi:hypothetical protein